MCAARKAIFIFVVAILVMPLFFFIVSQSQYSVRKNLQKIPAEERDCLEWFLRRAVAGDTLGYVLFGEKPIAVIGFCDPQVQLHWIEDWIDHIPRSLYADNLKMLRGWEVWEKHKDLFPLRNYAFVQSKNFVENDFQALIFINKKAFLKTVRLYLNDFRAVLGNDVTPELLLREVLQSNDVFSKVFRNHQGLIGTILGYGRHNAWLFHEREMSHPYMKVRWNRLVKLSAGNGRNKQKKICQLLQPFVDGKSSDLNMFSLGLPRFVADLHHAETRNLKREYWDVYQHIMERYKKHDFLEATLEQMTAE